MRKQWMKHLASALFIIGIAVAAFAQQPEGTQQKRPERREKREIPSPENNARRTMREFKKTFQLTDKEYEKVYELYLKYEKSLLPEQMEGNRGGMPPRGGFGGPGFGAPGFGGSGFGGPGMGGGMGMPPQGDFQPGGDMPQGMEFMMERMRKEQEVKREKAAKTLKKKKKKVLKGERYEQWLQWEAGRKPVGRMDF